MTRDFLRVSDARLTQIWEDPNPLSTDCHTHWLCGRPRRRMKERVGEDLFQADARLRDQLLALLPAEQNLVTVIVSTPNGVLLIQLDESFCTGQDAEVWSSPCKMVSSDEDPAAAALAVLLDDLGVDADPSTIRKIRTCIIGDMVHHWLHHVFVWEPPNPIPEIRLGVGGKCYREFVSSDTVPRTFAMPNDRESVFLFID